MELCSKVYARTSVILSAMFSNKKKLICLRIHFEMFWHLMDIGACDYFSLHAWLSQYLMELEYYALQISEVVWTFLMVVVMNSEKNGILCWIISVK